ncbi:MAG: alpha-rhamnosidase [Prevotellaceae bacterium]|nr:alpha-rhamnosidase [Prevotellaceae bacterium]
MKKNMKHLLLASLMLAGTAQGMAGVATWIWYPGDYEIWMSNEMQNRRTERGAFFPPFWRMDSHYVLVEFSTKLSLAAAEEVEIAAEGRYNVKLDGKLQPGEPSKLAIPAGQHALNIKVYNQQKPPAIFVKGATVASDTSWVATFEDKEWIDASGKASDQSGTVYAKVGAWNFNDPTAIPSQFKLATTPKAAVKTDRSAQSVLVDFGQETFGFVKLHGLKGKGNLTVYYGESKEEALDKEHCETFDRLSSLNHPQPKDFTMESSRALRYANVVWDGTLAFDNVSMLYEHMPEVNRGAFRCSDEEVNRIWDVAAHTLQLSTRELFVDGIKRDRWVWSGDAYQSFLMSNYLFFDSPAVERTLFALRGKDPVTSHINTIMDYTFYWFMGAYDHYLYTGRKPFIQQLYPRMVSMMDYVLSRRNDFGMLEGRSGDWVFVDWAEFPMSKKGELSFEQLLFCQSLKAMSKCAEVVGDTAGATRYAELAQELRGKFLIAFWSKGANAFVHNREEGRRSTQVTPYTNIFAVLQNFFDENPAFAAAQRKSIRDNVLLNPKALKITTPYMRFYELDALCTLGEHEHVMREMKSYWGGMLGLGATSFWEKYDPKESGAQHLAMYGRPYGRSLCHAWGASPIYLLGKHYLGVQPTAPGYSEFVITPALGGLKWMKGKVPTPHGDIAVYVSTDTIKVTAPAGKGYLYFKSLRTPKSNIGSVEKVIDGYRLQLAERGKEYVLSYKSEQP